MPRNYRPRPYQDRSCQHCRLVFQTNHSRTKYCGDSCRVKAFYARQNDQEPRSHRAGGNLPFTLQNIGLTATGASVAAVLNYALNDHPSQKKIISLLEAIKKGQTKVNFTTDALVLAGINYIADFVGAQVAADITLGPRMLLAQQERLSRIDQNKQKAQLKLDAEINKLLGM